jgi:hypothetical protein
MPCVSVPTTATVLAATSAAASLAGTGLAIYSAQQQADFREKEAEYQQQMAERQQAIAMQQAQMARDQAQVDVGTERFKTRAAIGALRAHAAANGVDLASGSPLDLQADLASQGELKAETILNNGERQAWGFENQAVNALGKGYLDAASSRQKGFESGLSAIGSALSMAERLPGTVDKLKGAFSVPKPAKD